MMRTESESRSSFVRVAVDAMGGDFGMEPNVLGTLEALAADPQLQVTLIGDTQALEKEFARLKRESDPLRSRIKIVHSDEVITMEDSATTAIRKKKGSTIHVGLEAVKSNEADAFLSAGNSGAIMAGALLLLGRIAEVERPAIIVRMPTAEGHVIILDAGANVDCKPTHLVQFAEMGHVFAEVVEGRMHPRIAVLSNGSESHKGNELTRETHRALSIRQNLNYRGYVEGHDIFRGTADVIVCDGFVGNVILKLSEGLAETCFQWFRKEIRKDFMGLVGVVLLKRLLRRFKEKFDYQPYGAAPLLGIDGLVLISHGSSTTTAIKNGILTAKRAAETGFIPKIREQLAHYRENSAGDAKEGKS